MAKRYHISFSSLSGVAYDLEIHDSEHSGVSEEMNGRTEGFSVNWEGSGNDLFESIIGSSVSFNMLIEQELPSLEIFVEDLVAADEERFTLVIYRETAFYWGGFILTDQVSFEDRFYPFNLNLFAIDGLARLRDLDYKDRYFANEFSLFFPERFTILEYLFDIIDITKLPEKLEYTSSQTMLLHNIDWFEENMNTAIDPLTQVTIDNSIFVETDKKGNRNYTSGYALLEAICEKFGARIFWLYGRFHFYQMAAYKNINQEVYSYSFNRSFQAKTTTGYLADLNYISNFKEAGINYSFLSPHKRVCVNYDHSSDPNIAKGLVFDDSTTDYVTLPSEIINESPYETTIDILARIKTTSSQPIDFVFDPNNPTGSNGTLFINHRYEIRIYLRWGDEVFWRKTFGNLAALNDPSQGYWTEPSQFNEPFIHAYSPLITVNESLWEQIYEVQVTTPPLPEATELGKLEVKVVLERVWGPNDENLLLGDHPEWYSWKLDDLSIILENPDLGEDPDEKTRRVCVESDSTGNTAEKTYETSFGDGPFPYTERRLALLDGSQTVNWRRGTTGDLFSIEQLLGKEYLSLHAKPVRVLQGNLLDGNLDMRTQLLDNSNGISYVPLRMSLSAYYDRWSVEMAQIAFFDLSLIFPPPIINPGGTTTGGTTFGGSVRNEIGASTPVHNSQTLNTGTIATILGSTTTSVVNTPNVVNVNHELTIDPLDYPFLRAGDKFKILHYATNQWEELTVASNYVPGSSTVSIVEDLQYTHSPEATISISYSSIAQNIQPFVQKEENFSGQYWNITAGILPDPATVSEDVIDRKVKVWRSSGRLVYNFNVGFDIDVSGTNNRIIFKPKCRGENVFIEVTN